MALPLEQTMADVRQAVFRRCGIATSGGLTTERNAIVNEQIKRVNSILFMRFEWTRRMIETDVALTANLATYDIPDDCEPGRIARLMALDADGREYEIINDDRIAVRRAMVASDSGQPVFYSWMNEVITLRPAPNTEWVTLRFTYVPRAATLVVDNDRMSVDSEAVIQGATVACKRLWDIGGSVSREIKEHDAYVMGLRDISKTPEMFNIASEQLGDGRGARNDNAWRTNWNPPGGW